MKKELVLCVILIVALLIAGGCGQDAAAPAGDADSGEENFSHDHDDGDDHGHEHGEEPYEWSGVFTFSEGEYTLVFGESGDPSIAVVFLLNEGNRDGSDHLAYHIMEVELETVPAGGTFEAVPEYGYNLMLNADETITTFVISEAGEYLLYMEHMPVEFDLKVIGSSGAELVPADEMTY